MKSILFFFVTTIFLSSCSPKDDTPSIVGTWKIQSALFWEGSSARDGIGQGQAWTNECQKQEMLIFTDKILKKYSYNQNSDGSCLEDVTESSYSISNEVLTYSTFGESVSFQFTIWDNTEEVRMRIIEVLSDGKKIARTYKKQ